jgi:hypothetical protein
VIFKKVNEIINKKGEYMIKKICNPMLDEKYICHQLLKLI